MSRNPIIQAGDRRLSPTPFFEAPAFPEDHHPAIRADPTERIPLTTEGGDAVGPPSPTHRLHAAAMIRQLGGRTEATLRRELDRFFAARPDLSHSDRAAIARAMSRFRNRLLHHPRSTLRAAAAEDDPVGAHRMLATFRQLFGLAHGPSSNQGDPLTVGNHP